MALILESFTFFVVRNLAPAQAIFVTASFVAIVIALEASHSCETSGVSASATPSTKTPLATRSISQSNGDFIYWDNIFFCSLDPFSSSAASFGVSA